MAKFTKITRDCFDDCLSESKGWVRTIPAGSREYVYEWEIPNTAAVIRVYSSVTPSGGARRCGSDAIRVCAILRVGAATRGLMSSRRVHRVEGWRTNLKNRILSVLTGARLRVRWTSNVRWIDDQDDGERIEAEQSDVPVYRMSIPTHDVECDNCQGTGEYRWGALVNGRMTHRGVCYRCRGKGVQTVEDQKRNYGYDQHRQVV